MEVGPKMCWIKTYGDSVRESTVSKFVGNTGQSVLIKDLAPDKCGWINSTVLIQHKGVNFI